MRPLLELIRRYPNLTAWVVLSIGFVAMLLVAARDVNLLPSQLLAMVVACIVLAGLCVWIINWD
jgi:predicted tellurium resistance membrane protein TerC